MKQVLLLRAYGDFVIALKTASISKSVENYRLYASLHLKPLFDAIPTSFLHPNLQIEFVDWGITNSMLGAFTNKNLFQLNTIKELLSLKNWLGKQPNDGSWTVEQSIRKKWLELLLGKKLAYIADVKNVYDSYSSFFEAKLTSIEKNPAQINKVLILPSARLVFRNIPPTIIQKIKKEHEQNNRLVTIAYYKPQLAALNQSVDTNSSYSSFSELVHYILEADYIYTPDSLTAHLSFLFNKPHTILYPTKVPPHFFTPYALSNQTYFSFAEFNHQQYLHS